jgi:hypothetical protein
LTSFFPVVSATMPTKVAAFRYLDLVAPGQKWRKSRLGVWVTGEGSPVSGSTG